MLLPGPEAQQLATYIGWLLHGYRGGLVAGALFVLPGFLSILILSVLYAGFSRMPLVSALLFGVKAAVLAIVVEAVFKVGSRVCKNATMLALSALAFVAILFFQVPFPLIVLGAGVIGLVGGWLNPSQFVVLEPKKAKSDGGDAAPMVDAILQRDPGPGRASLARTLTVLLVFGAAWAVPIAAAALIAGAGSVYAQQGVFFSKAAVVTFGGAYSVLAYIAQQAVEKYGWLEPGEMLDGLGMAETTPGPLIQVVQFVAFMGAYRNAGLLHPMLAGVIGSVLTTWVTYVPCFLYVFLGAPYVERLRGNKKLSAALSAITAAVVGVILNLAIWFALHVVFRNVDEVDGPLATRLLVPEWATVDLAALAIAVLAAVAIFRFKAGMLLTLGGSAVLGIVYYLAVGR
jgi:chromate transporter